MKFDSLCMKLQECFRLMATLVSILFSLDSCLFFVCICVCVYLCVCLSQIFAQSWFFHNPLTDLSQILNLRSNYIPWPPKKISGQSVHVRARNSTKREHPWWKRTEPIKHQFLHNPLTDSLQIRNLRCQHTSWPPKKISGQSVHVRARKSTKRATSWHAIWHR